MTARASRIPDPGSRPATARPRDDRGPQLARATGDTATREWSRDEFRTAGADGQPSETAGGHPTISTPHAGGRVFDDSAWEPISARRSISARRGNGRLSFNWYRSKFDRPESVGGFDPTGSTAVFETSVDDYAEVWVDGELARARVRPDGSVIAGWNANEPARDRAQREAWPEDPTRDLRGERTSVESADELHLAAAGAAVFYRAQRGPVAITPAEVNVEVDSQGPGHR